MNSIIYEYGDNLSVTSKFIQTLINMHTYINIITLSVKYVISMYN